MAQEEREMKFPLLAKVGAIALVGLMLTLVLWRIEGLLGERKSRGDEAVRGVERSHAAAQSVLGPLLVRSCTEEWEDVTDSDKGRSVKPMRQDFDLRQAPGRLTVDARTQTDPLRRGLFKINTWAGHFTVAADFPSFASLQPGASQHAGGRIRCGAPALLVALSDVRGVRAAAVNVDGQLLAAEPGVVGSGYPGGLHVTLPLARIEGDAGVRPLSAHLDLDLIGTRQLAWVPAAGSLRWTLRSDWPHPSFGGQFAPEQREVRADGFGATWNLSALATNAASDIDTGLALCAPAGIGEPSDDSGELAAKSDKCLDLMSVAFIDPVNPYVLSDRATKYDLLFIVLTFIAVGLIEVLSGRRVHPVQYALVGLALSLFFLLLLSLSEHLPFEQAYAAAASACALLLGIYATSMLGRKLAGLMFGLGIALLYGLLYALLQMEQNALVIGSVMLFAALATVMMLTRRIDWYALFARLRSGAGQADEAAA
jgi:inner membrane protein